MKRIKLHILLMMMAMTLASLLLSCVDDELRYYGPDGIPEGNTQVTLNLDFTPFEEADLTRSTKAPAGNAMRDVTDLCILVYDKEGNLVKEVENEAGEVVERFPKEIKGYKVEFVDRNSSDDSNPANKNAESQTAHIANVKLTLSYGIYYIYAVANLGDYSKGGDGSVLTNVSTYQKLTGTGKYADKIGTVNGLLSMKVGWVPGNIVDNREMLGMFTLDSERHVPSYSTTHATVRIDRDNTVLHTWLRRCASKVTVDFDGTGLRENVKVYIHSVKVVDIADKCTLGFGRKGKNGSGDYEGSENSYNNSVTTDTRVETVPEGSEDTYMIQSIHHIDFGEGLVGSDKIPGVDSEGNATDVFTYTTWPCIAKGSPYIVDEAGNKIDFHHENAYALFFYENMQGDAPYGKIPVADLDNGGVAGQGPNGEKLNKDGVPKGTYIEVDGWYTSNANGNSSGGHKICYRFMLGKDVEKNCDVERNYHYKLTLKLRGNGNDADWHIDYNEPDGFEIPDPWYVSYLYNHDSMMPFKYNMPSEDWEIVDLKAQIVHNPWYPDDMDEDEYASEAKNDHKYLGNGFLSLRPASLVSITKNEIGSDYNYNTGAEYYNNAKFNNANDNYYLGISDASKQVNRSERTYIEGGVAEKWSNDREAFSYEKIGKKMNFSIPLFTQSKVLIKESGYTGNNPYVGHTRTAKLNVYIKIRNIKTGETKEDNQEISVIQVRRIVNPKGVYRKAGNNEDFHVKLLRLPGDDETKFVEFQSDGPWMAEVVGDPNFITLDGKQQIYGSTKSFIDFTIKFNKTNVDPNDERIRNAVVRVRYHNYTCTHLIFVRQGYAPQEMSGVKWETCNLIDKNTSAKDPRDEGSMFKFGNIDQAIDAVSNNNQWVPWVNIKPTDFKAPANFIMADGTTSVWSDIKYDRKKGFVDTNVATIDDYYTLYRPAENFDPDKVKIWHGFGVLYADGANEVQYDVKDAYGYFRDNENAGKQGMRGLFVYHWDLSNASDPENCRNIFFPIGRSGYGHRRQTDAQGGAGTLRYSTGRVNIFPTPEDEAGWRQRAPLFYDLYKRPGGIYYCREEKDKVKDWADNLQDNVMGFDMNYFSFDVNLIQGSNLQQGQDACFLRCIVPK